MTVVHFSAGNCFGGVEVHICTLIKLMQGSGISFKVVCRKAVLHEFEKQLAGLDAEVIAIELRPGLKSYLSLIKVFKALSPDIVHCHLYSATRLGAPAAKFAGVDKVIETIHLEEVWRRGLKKLLFCTADAVIGRLFVDRYIAVSKAVSLYYQQNKAVPSKKITLIHNTTPLEDVEIHPREFSFRIGFLGRLSEQKGVDVLIKAVALIRKKGIPCELVIGGTGPLLANLKQEAMDCEIEETVNFPGHISDKNEFFGMIDIFALPSRNEGFPLVLLEAGMYQMPVVATRVSGNPEIIVHEETGLLVESENPDELAAALLKFRDAGKREVLSKNLRKLVESEFSPKITYRKWMHFISRWTDDLS